MTIQENQIRILITMYANAIKDYQPKLLNAQGNGFYSMAGHYKEMILVAESKIEAYTEVLEGIGK
jgi:hypothetical protein